jgi:uncharacterized protein YjbI with pentapeptide repeats
MIGKDLYPYYKAQKSLSQQIEQFIRTRGIELTIALVGLFIGLATVLVSYKVGIHQEILQASRMTDSYFNGVAELFSKSIDENKKINLLIIARTEALIEDLQELKKPTKLASVITFVSNLKPDLFYKDTRPEFLREVYIYLGGINLSGSVLRNINLEKARFSYSNLQECDLTRTNFKGAVFKKANLSKANLSHAHFDDANLQSANLYKAIIASTSFENANLENAIWVNGKKCKPGSIGKCVQ